MRRGSSLKNACQALKPVNPFPINNIHVSYELRSSRYTEYTDQKTSKLRQRSGSNPFITSILATTHLL